MNKGFGLAVHKSEVIPEIRFVENYFDNLNFKSRDLEFALEGVIINDSELLNRFADRDKQELLTNLYKKYGIHFLNELEGEFCGYLHDKQTGKVYVFMNFTATRKLFYYSGSNLFLADTNLSRLKQKLEEYNIETKFSKESAYCLLTCSNLLEDMTPLEGVKKLLDRQYVEFDIEKNELRIKEYFSWNELAPFSGGKEQAIDLIHEAFEESVKFEYSKDQKLGLNNTALLSGGLDSRMALLYANRLGYKPHEVLCFSQKGYLDESIARKISKRYNFPFLFVPLNGGEYLKDVDEVTAISEGTVRFTGGIHTNYAYRFMNRKNQGLIHSGQLGDGVLGGFNKKPYKIPPSKRKIIYSEFLFGKFSDSFHAIINQYDSEELFLLRNVGYNRAVLGSYVAEEFTFQTSPFMTSFFLKLAVSFPEAMKYNQKLYLDWLNKHCKEAAGFNWERTLLKPDAHWKTRFGDEFMVRAHRLIQEKLLGNLENSKMANYEFYFLRNEGINKFISDYFKKNLPKIEDNELREDIAKMYKEGNFNEKMLVITVLASHKHLFG